MKKIFTIGLFSVGLCSTGISATPDTPIHDNGYFAKIFLIENPDYCPEVFISSPINHIDDTESCKIFWSKLHTGKTHDMPAAMRALMVINGLGGQKQDTQKALDLALADGVNDDEFPGLLSDIKARIKNPNLLKQKLMLESYVSSSEAGSSPVYQAQYDVQSSYTVLFLDKFIAHTPLSSTTLASLKNVYDSLINYAMSHTSESLFPAAGDASGNDSMANDDYQQTLKRFCQLVQLFTQNPAQFIQTNSSNGINDAILIEKYTEASKLEQTKQCQELGDTCSKMLDPQLPWLKYRTSFIQFAQQYCAELTANQTVNTHMKSCSNYTNQEIAQSISNYLIKERLADLNNVIDRLKDPTNY